MEEEKILNPRLAVNIQDVRDVFNAEDDPRVLFTMRHRDEYTKNYVCTSFRLTLNHMFLLELEEVDYRYVRDGQGLAFHDAATSYDIIHCLEEMNLGDNWCCLCQLPDGNYAVITDEVYSVDGLCRIVNILAMSTRQNE